MNIKHLLLLSGFVLFLIYSQKGLTFPGTEQTYIKPLPNLSLVLDPQSMEDSYSFHVSSQIYDTLFEFDEFLTLKPNLAETYQVTNGGKTITIKLKPNIKFHNGKQLDIDDVIYTIQRFVKKTYYRYPEMLFVEGSDNFISGRTNSVSGIKKLTNLSMEISLRVPSPTFIMLLATPSLGVLPRDLNGIADNRFFESPVGTGPFKIESFKKDQELRLIANKHYFKYPPRLDIIIYKYATREQAIKGFNNGLFHDLEWYNAEPKEINVSYNVTKFPLPKTVVLLFNVKKPPFNNKLVRKAFSLALDKSKLMSECFADKIMAQGFIPIGMGGYDRNFPSEQFNLPKSREIMSSQKTGKQQTDVNIQWMEYHPCSRKFDQLVKGDLLAVGFSPSFNYITFHEFLDETNKFRNYNVIEARLAADYPDVISMLRYFKSDYKYNYAGFSSKKYDEFLDKALKTVDKHERYKLYQECSKILEEENVVINLYYDVQSIIYQKNIRGVKVSPMAFLAMPMNYVYLEE